MKATRAPFDELATLSRCIFDLSESIDRTDGERETALVAIHELARTLHDALDFEFRRARPSEPGIGFLGGVAAALDDELRAAKRRPPDVTAAARARGSRKELQDSTTPAVYPATPHRGQS